MTTSSDIREQIILAGQRLEQHGMIAGSDGNISARLGSNRILITPSGVNKGRLVPDDLVVVDLDGNKVNGDRKPTSEMAMHLFLYRARPDINACVHAHPPFATAFALVGQELPSDLLPEVVVFVGRIPLTDYAPPGTEALPKSLQPFVESHNAFLLRNHGLVTVGRNLHEAHNRHETVEHYAHILWIARQLGTCQTIPPEDLYRLQQLRQTLLTTPLAHRPGGEQ